MLAALSLLAPFEPLYDPWAWLVWGRELPTSISTPAPGRRGSRCRCWSTALLAARRRRGPELWLVVARAGWLAAPLAYRSPGGCAPRSVERLGEASLGGAAGAGLAAGDRVRAADRPVHSLDASVRGRAGRAAAGRARARRDRPRARGRRGQALGLRPPRPAAPRGVAVAGALRDLGLARAAPAAPLRWSAGAAAIAGAVAGPRPARLRRRAPSGRRARPRGRARAAGGARVGRSEMPLAALWAGAAVAVVAERWRHGEREPPCWRRGGRLDGDRRGAGGRGLRRAAPLRGARGGGASRARRGRAGARGVRRSTGCGRAIARRRWHRVWPSVAQAGARAAEIPGELERAAATTVARSTDLASSSPSRGRRRSLDAGRLRDVRTSCSCRRSPGSWTCRSATSSGHLGRARSRRPAW